MRRSCLSEETVERYVGYLRRLLEGMVAGAGAGMVEELELLSEEEREQVLYGVERDREWSMRGSSVCMSCSRSR